MNWNDLNTIEQLEMINERSFEKKQAIFKHSTRCSISSMVKNRVERDYDISPDDLDIYYLDLLAYRDISNQVAQKWGILHESPQMIIIESGQAIDHASHHMINVADIKQILNS